MMATDVHRRPPQPENQSHSEGKVRSKLRAFLSKKLGVTDVNALEALTDQWLKEWSEADVLGEALIGYKAAAFWFRKLENRDLGIGSDDRYLDEYLAAKHHLSPGQIDKLTYAEIAFILQNDFHQQVAPSRAKPARKRRRASERKPKPLTTKETEAMHLVGEHKGNITATADAVGVSRQAMKKRYDRALAKLGKEAVKTPKTQRLPEDHRGQVNLWK